MTRNWIAVAVLVSAASMARAADKAPKPGPEVEKLGFFVGKWKTTGELKESPFMPAGKYTEKASCEWFSGKFSVICRIKGKGPMGTWRGSGSWATAPRRRPTSTTASTTPRWPGPASRRGTFADGVWTYDDESRMGGQMVKSRYVMKQNGKKAYTSTWSVLGADGKWQTVMEATSTRE